MNKNLIPKWQEELRSFIGIKKGIILEGNVYDEFPRYSYEANDVIYQDFNNLNQTILGLTDQEKTDVIFFDPVNGFYCYSDSIESQRKKMMPLFDEYCVNEMLIDHDCTICFMPIKKKKDINSSTETEQMIWVSEIVRSVIIDSSKYSSKEKVLFVLNFASRLNSCNIRESEANKMFINLMAATTSTQLSQLFCSSFIMVVDKCNDIPAWVYLNNPNIRNLSICLPDRNLRRLYLNNLYGELELYHNLSDTEYEPGVQFVAETEGLQLQEIRQILQLAYKKGISSENIELAFRLYKYGVLENPWENLENGILNHIESKLEERVKGQKEALDKVKLVVTRAVKGLSGLQHSGASHKPKGILFFAGPTGVGKTETAKALAESIFGDENAFIRFDMSEYRLEASEQKLFGAPPGYIGYEGGGQLTNAVKSKPFSVILFDEIEKASPTILDKFLQILEDGRMSDNQGNTVYFGETIIIFTSNIGLTKETDEPTNIFRKNPHRVPTITIEDPLKEDSEGFRNKVKELLTNGVKSYFIDNGRPELLNRIGEDNIVVFQFINVKDAVTICDYKLNKICEEIKSRKNIEIQIEEVKDFLHQKAIESRADGGRGVANMLEREFLNPFGRFMCTLSGMPTKLRCYNGNCGIEFEVILNEN